MDDPYFSLLQEVIVKAYAPYSRFPVAAVALQNEMQSILLITQDTPGLAIRG